MATDLRRIDEHDLELLYEWYDDPRLYDDLVGDYQHRPRDEAIRYMRDHWLDSPHTLRCIISQDGRDIGLVALSHICRKTHTADIDIFIREAGLRGKHIGRGALSRMLDNGFFECGLKNIYLDVLERNEIAVKMYQALGFEADLNAKKTVIKNGEEFRVIRMNLSKAKHAEQKFKNDGWALFPAQLGEESLSSIRAALDKTYETQKSLHKKNGMAGESLNGILHCLPGFDTAFDNFLAELPLQDVITDFFGKPYILNNFGGVINFPKSESYVRKPHRDVRDFTYPFRLMMNMMVMVDDFTVENGATHILPGSHRQQSESEKDLFATESVQITGKAGDIVLWDSNLLHSAGQNKTGEIRRALTLCFSRPYVKPTIDFLTALPQDFIDRQSDFVKQLLGCYARPAKDLDEFFQPPEKRSYRM